jgi:hypothetical protein
MPVDYTLYGGEHSLFTGKARAYMRYKGLHWEERPATREVYRNIILPNIGAPIIPVLETAAGSISRTPQISSTFWKRGIPGHPSRLANK